VKLYGVTGAQGAGRAALSVRLAAEFAARGLRVSTVQEVDPDFDVDRPGKDSWRHRAAGAREVILASRRRVARMTELRGAPPPLSELLAHLAPVDLVLVEGFAGESHLKVARVPGGPPCLPDDPTVRAVVCDGAPDFGRPVFAPDDIAGLADFISRELDL
jgi:molybdopterin-guanine dinucleotide biosynthesis protein MobB